MRALLLAALCSGCGADKPPCVEDLRTITTGLYGQAKYVDTKLQSQPLTKVPISIAGSGLGSTMGFVDLRTDDHGFYELDLPSGRYQICSDFLAVGCDDAFLGSDGEGELVRIDLHVDEGIRGFWDFASSGCL